MKPYYQDDEVTLYHGNCLEITEWLRADVLVTDPPYGIGGKLSSSWKGKKPKGWAPVHQRQTWDDDLQTRDAMLSMWGDKPSCVFGSPRRLDAAPVFREMPLVWDKQTVGMGDTSFPWGPSYELIFIAGKGWSGKREGSVIRVGTHLPTAARDVGHPTPKPIPLMELIVSKAPKGIVCDPFAGGGSTLIAARNLGRKAIGIELDERYCEVIARRLSQDILNFGDTA